METPSGKIAGQVYSNHAYSALARCLPQLDQLPIFNASNFTLEATLSSSLWANLTAMNAAVSTFICPSDGVSAPAGYGRVDYRFNTGPGPWFAPSPKKQLSEAGPFTTHHFYAAASYTDGLSQTVGVSERLQGNWVAGVWCPGNYTRTGVGDGLLGHISDFLTIDWAVSVCASTSSSTPIETRSGESWFLSGFHFTDYNHSSTPNSVIRDCSLYSFQENIHWRTIHEGVFTARSNHPGGSELAFNGWKCTLRSRLR